MQGFNMGRYVPPDLEGTTSANKASGKGHALGARARKLKTEGILTVRFELPFAVWCTNCRPEQIIGQGVRFNAEKSKVGMYYSTQVWGFRFKHSVCGGWLEVRTDPKKAEYVVVDGGRKRDYGVEDKEEHVGVTEEEKARLEMDGGFAGVERKVEDKQKAKSEGERIEELKGRSERDWSDPYERSRMLRREFRVGRKRREEEGRRGEALKEKLSLGIDLLDEKDEDGVRARLVDFGDGAGDGVRDARPMFDRGDTIPATGQTSIGKRTKSADLVAENKAALQKKLTGNTRAAVDPFLREEKAWQPRVKRKRTEDSGSEAPSTLSRSLALVGYDSDSS